MSYTGGPGGAGPGRGRAPGRVAAPGPRRSVPPGGEGAGTHGRSCQRPKMAPRLSPRSAPLTPPRLGAASGAFGAVWGRLGGASGRRVRSPPAERRVRGRAGGFRPVLSGRASPVPSLLPRRPVSARAVPVGSARAPAAPPGARGWAWGRLILPPLRGARLCSPGPARRPGGEPCRGPGVARLPSGGPGPGPVPTATHAPHTASASRLSPCPVSLPCPLYPCRLSLPAPSRAPLRGSSSALSSLPARGGHPHASPSLWPFRSTLLTWLFIFGRGGGGTHLGELRHHAT